MTASSSAAWLRLASIPGVGAITAQRLLQAFARPENIFSASFSELREVVPEKIARALQAKPGSRETAIFAKAQAWLSKPNCHLLTWQDENYPEALRNIPDPPFLLYAQGRLDLLRCCGVAVVGNRQATVQGKKDAQYFAEFFSQNGWLVISGLAEGIDTAAHLGALSQKQEMAGSTLAVMGTGMDVIYPPSNQRLAQKIAQHGCILSEYPLGMPGMAKNFPKRNRIIAGLSRGIVVIEAAHHSGSLITARMAAEQGREVFALPGSIHAPLSKGCHQLILQGATLVESPQDVLQILNGLPAIASPERNFCNFSIKTTAITPESAAHPLLLHLGYEAVDLDTLALDAQQDIAVLQETLLMLELQGHVEALPGGRYRRLHTHL